MGLAVAVGPTIVLVSFLYNDYAYHVGTPTTAKNVVCVDHPSSRFARYHYDDQTCTATWSLGGQSYTGEIVGASNGDRSVDVRVYYGTAFTANAVHNIVPVGLLAVGGIIVLFAFGFRYESRRAARARARAVDKTDPTITNVRCWVCQHVQTVPVSQGAFSCEQCGAQLNRRKAPAKGI